MIKDKRLSENSLEYTELVKKEVDHFVKNLKRFLKDYENKVIDDYFNSSVDKLLIQSLDRLKKKIDKPFNSFVKEFITFAVKNPKDIILQSAALRVYDTYKYYGYWKMGEDYIYIEEEGIRRLMSRMLIYDILFERGLLKDNNILKVNKIGVR